MLLLASRSALNIFHPTAPDEKMIRYLLLIIISVLNLALSLVLFDAWQGLFLIEVMFST